MADNKVSSIKLTGESVTLLNEICSARRNKSNFKCTQPLVLIDLIAKAHKREVK